MLPATPDPLPGVTAIVHGSGRPTATVATQDSEKRRGEPWPRRRRPCRPALNDVGFVCRAALRSPGCHFRAPPPARGRRSGGYRPVSDLVVFMHPISSYSSG
ncbi:hypothetical protein VTK26DRAFT_1958 [Humicola hyalothermophila]